MAGGPFAQVNKRRHEQKVSRERREARDAADRAFRAWIDAGEPGKFQDWYTANPKAGKE